MLNKNIQGFQSWISTKSTLSSRAKRDVISRLRRAFKLSTSEFDGCQEVFLSEIRQNPKWNEIPQSSRAGIERSVNLFYEYLAKEGDDTV